MQSKCFFKFSYVGLLERQIKYNFSFELKDEKSREKSNSISFTTLR